MLILLGWWEKLNLSLSRFYHFLELCLRLSFCDKTRLHEGGQIWPPVIGLQGEEGGEQNGGPQDRKR